MNIELAKEKIKGVPGAPKSLRKGKQVIIPKELIDELSDEEIRRTYNKFAYLVGYRNQGKQFKTRAQGISRLIYAQNKYIIMNNP